MMGFLRTGDRNLTPDARSEVFYIGASRAILCLMQSEPRSDHLNQKQTPLQPVQDEAGKALEQSAASSPPELLALFRLLVREPPPDHDFKTCAVCQRYGIADI
jgi:hypothetical protein